MSIELASTLFINAQVDIVSGVGSSALPLPPSTNPVHYLTT